MPDTCSTCRFRHPDERPGYEGAGECRRFPPSVLIWTVAHPDEPTQPGFEQHFPWMQADGWCGEHQTKRTYVA